MVTDCSVVLVSFGRPQLVARQIAFLSNRGLDIIIVDGSTQAMKLGDITGTGSETLRYFHVPGEHNYVERLIIGLAEVRTSFFCLMDDSDILIPETLFSIIEWLRRNPGYCAAGQVYRAISESEVVRLTRWGHWSEELVLDDTSYVRNFESVLKKVRTANLFYVVTPSSVRESIVKDLIHLNELDPKTTYETIEILMAGLYLSRLRFRKFNLPFWIRCDAKEENVVEEKQNKSTVPPFDRYSNMVALLVELFKRVAPFSAESEKIVLKAVEGYQKKMEQLLEADVTNVSRQSKINLNFKPSVRKLLILFAEKHAPYLLLERRKKFALSIEDEGFEINETLGMCEPEMRSKTRGDIYMALCLWFLNIGSLIALKD